MDLKWLRDYLALKGLAQFHCVDRTLTTVFQGILADPGVDYRVKAGAMLCLGEFDNVTGLLADLFASCHLQHFTLEFFRVAPVFLHLDPLLDPILLDIYPVHKIGGRSYSIPSPKMKV